MTMRFRIFRQKVVPIMPIYSVVEAFVRIVIVNNAILRALCEINTG